MDPITKAASSHIQMLLQVIINCVKLVKAQNTGQIPKSSLSADFLCCKKRRA